MAVHHNAAYLQHSKSSELTQLTVEHRALGLAYERADARANPKILRSLAGRTVS